MNFSNKPQLDKTHKQKNMKKYEFKTKILKHDNLDAAYIEFPFDVEKEFGTKGQVKVKAYFDEYEYRGSLVKMGRPCYFIGLNKKVRTAINKGLGDMVNVVIFRDTEERALEIPQIMEKKLSAHPKEKLFFDKLSFTHKREYVEWITSAKKEETKINRLNKFILMLQSGKKEPN